MVVTSDSCDVARLKNLLIVDETITERQAKCQVD